MPYKSLTLPPTKTEGADILATEMALLSNCISCPKSSAIDFQRIADNSHCNVRRTRRNAAIPRCLDTNWQTKSGTTSFAAKNSSKSPLRLTFLEGNTWLWEISGLNVLVDPVLVGNLDFGVPWLYTGAKRILKDFRLEDLPDLNCLVISQSLDDHCHKRTLESLSKMYQDLHVISTPNAEPILKTLFNKVTYIEPGQKTQLRGKNGSELIIRASAGPILGPPWRRPENGYFIEADDAKFTLYFEPHCVYNRSLLEQEQADIVITPVVKQLLPAFTLVSGQEDAVELARLLQARFIVPMKNGDIESKGILSKFIFADGTTESFKVLLSKTLPDVKVLEPIPGIPLEVPVGE